MIMAASIHELAHVQGDVELAESVQIAAGAAVYGDGSLHISSGSVVQTAALVQAQPGAKVMGDNHTPYAIWIGSRTTIAHKALVFGPAYVGDNCFIGFQSTVINARIGHGSIVMLHALVQDVEIPAGKCVPSGAIITDQDQADSLPDVQPSDLAFVQAVLTPRSPVSMPTAVNGTATVDLRQHVQHLLAQGCRIATEYADARHFRAKSWTAGEVIDSSRPDVVLAALSQALAAAEGYYVRLIGVDTQAKRRVFEEIIQRPGEAAPTISAAAATSSPASRPAPVQAKGNAAVSGDVYQTVQSLLAQGFLIGTEHANKRRYRVNAWYSCAPFSSTRPESVMQELAQCLQEHQGEYVRLIGIDPKQKRRVHEGIIQRPGETVNLASSAPSASRSSGRASVNSGASSAAQGSWQQTVQQILAQGYRVGIEYADARRYRAKSWTTYPSAQSNREADVIAQVNACLTENPGVYVRLIGIEGKSRASQVMIQRPGEAPVSAPSNGQANGRKASPTNGQGFSSGGSSRLTAEAQNQVRQLLQQGMVIGTEHADQRRYRAKSWQSCSPIASKQAQSVISALEACLDEHQGEYVRLIGIDPTAKRRVLETVIQRP